MVLGRAHAELSGRQERRFRSGSDCGYQVRRRHASVVSRHWCLEIGRPDCETSLWLGLRVPIGPEIWAQEFIRNNHRSRLRLSMKIIICPDCHLDVSLVVSTRKRASNWLGWRDYSARRHAGMLETCRFHEGEGAKRRRWWHLRRRARVFSEDERRVGTHSRQFQHGRKSDGKSQDRSVDDVSLFSSPTLRRRRLFRERLSPLLATEPLDFHHIPHGLQAETCRWCLRRDAGIPGCQTWASKLDA